MGKVYKLPDGWTRYDINPKTGCSERNTKSSPPYYVRKEILKDSVAITEGDKLIALVMPAGWRGQQP